MRLSEVSLAESALPADSLPAGGRDRPDDRRSLAERLARLPDAHPSAWSAAARSSPDWPSARTGGNPASEDTWWRGESDIWWRIPDGSPGEADCDDDTGGLDDPGELADSDDWVDADGPAGPGWAADSDDATGETGDQGSGTGARGGQSARWAPGAPGSDHGGRDGRWGGTGSAGPDQSGRDRGPYRPWFSADASGDPWFAAGLAGWVDRAKPGQR
jgi:hypothetical protein